MALRSNNGVDKYVEKGTYVKKGTTIVEAEPFVSVLHSKFRTERCNACFKSCKLSRCSGCQYVYYCSRNCQRQSWSVHKEECPHIKRIYPREIPDAALMLTRIIIKLRNGRGQERGYYSPTEYRTFKDLMSHYCNIKEDPKKLEHFYSLCGVLWELLPDSMMPEPKKLLEIFGRMIINCFHILDLDMASIGAGIYLGPSIIDHSCKPNAVTVFDGTTLIVRSLEDIPSFDWTKVSITYIDDLRFVEERRKGLKEAYFFWCDCERCRNPEVVATAAACPNKTCTNACSPDDSKCRKCGQEFPPNFQDDFEIACSNSLRILEKEEDNAYLDEYRKGLKQQEGLLHALNMLHVRMLERASDVTTKLQLWEEAEIYTTKVVKKYEFYYGESHPLTVHMYLVLCEVLAFGKKIKQAFDAIRKVMDIAKIAFGENHSKIHQVKTLAEWIVVEYKRINGE